MKILVIPDVHLKPWMFDRAAEWMKSGAADRALCLMDLPDDWHQELFLDAYVETFRRTVAFQKEFPDTLWCWGNHDICYPWNETESGYSFMAPYTVCSGLEELKDALPDLDQLAFIHRIDRILFTHGGLTEAFVRRYFTDSEYEDTDLVVRKINEMGHEELWDDSSPLWHRPQYSGATMYKEGELLQVVGHTPVERIQRVKSLISCDVFSTFRNRKPVGTEEFPLIDTETGEFRGLPGRR